MQDMGGKMIYNYDKAIKNFLNTVTKIVESNGDLEDIQTTCLVNLTTAVYAVAGELHKLNKNFESEMDDGR